MRGRIWALAAAAAALTACGTPSATLLPQAQPRGEALAYFAPDAPALLVVDTDPDAPHAAALAAALERAGALETVRRAAKRRGLVLAQVRRLLGGELVIGVPRPGAAPLAALVTPDGDALRTLADSRVVGRRATPAGTYRGASLYAGGDHAFAVRDGVLLVGRATADLRDALDERAGDDTFKGDDLEAALPRVKGTPPVRGRIDPDALVHGRARSVPWAAALESIGLVVRADGDGATLDFALRTTADALLEVDVPVSPGERAPLAVTARAPSVTVRDLAHVLGVAERAARSALPLAMLRLDQARRTLRARARVDLGEDVVGRLHGPATFVREHDAVLVRADPSRPRALRRALPRVARGLPQALERARLDGFGARRYGGFLEVLRDGQVVGRVGMVGDVLVAGTATPRALRALARAPLARPAGAAGGATLSVPREDAAAMTRDRLGLPLPWRLDGWARGAREGLRGTLHVAW